MGNFMMGLVVKVMLRVKVVERLVRGLKGFWWIDSRFCVKSLIVRCRICRGRVCLRVMLYVRCWVVLVRLWIRLKMFCGKMSWLKLLIVR